MIWSSGTTRKWFFRRKMKRTHRHRVLCLKEVRRRTQLTEQHRCVMHRAEGGSFAGKYRRDLRRTTVHDDSSQAWGLNVAEDKRPGFALHNL